MPSDYTSRNRLEKQAPGENSNTWGDRLNDNVIEMVDESMDGVASFSLSGSKTLTTNNAASDEARNRILDIAGGTGGTVIIPNVNKLYLVRNGTTGSVTVTTGSGTTHTVLPGNTQLVFCAGANVVRPGLVSNFGSTNISGTGSASFATLGRASLGAGYLSVVGMSSTDGGSNPIFVAAGSLTDTTLGSAYAVGYSKAAVASFLSTYAPVGAGWGFYVAAGGNVRVFLNGDTGNIHGKGYYIDGTNVIGARSTGWGAPTGTLTRLTFATSTVTLPQLAERLAALITDLRAHGLIGT